MNKKPKRLPGVFRKKNQRGSVLIELVVAAIIFALVVAAIAFYFIYHVGTIDNGRAQLKLQRVGSRLMEEMARALREGKTTDLAEENTIYTQIEISYPDINRHRCFSFDGLNKDIKEGKDPNYANLTPWEVLDDSRTVGGETYNHRIACDSSDGEPDPLWFEREGDRVTIRFKLIHDMETEDAGDDLDIEFGSTVKLRG
jgi:type II secretory pathway pseudopilin PulG